jgi:folate-binding protein YgfZ
MTETVSVRQSPLHEVHTQNGAQFEETDKYLQPASFGDVLREYAAVRERGAGLLDLTPRGRIKVTGSEAIQFLNGLITNDMKDLSENQWMPAAFPNVQGRLIASIRVIRLPDEDAPVFILDTEAATHQAVFKLVERFTLAGDFRVTDLTDTTALISLQGKQANQIATRLLGSSVADLGNKAACVVEWNGLNVSVLRATHTSADGFDLIIDAGKSTDLWNAFLKAGAWPVGLKALEMLRIEAGIARYGVDIDDTLVVSETNLDEAVSYTKGCYIGQEIIARIKYRGHVAKKLTGVMFEKATKVEPGGRLRSSDDKEAGRLTSVTYSPHLGRTVALGILKYQYLAAGTEVKLESDEIIGVVTDLPFIKGTE